MSSRNLETSHRLPAPLWRFAIACLLLLCFSWSFGEHYWQRTQQETASLWAHDWDSAYTDLSHYQYLYDRFHTAAFFHSEETFAYPAPTAVLFDGIYHLGANQLPLFLAAIALTALAAGFLFFRALIRSRVARDEAALFVLCILLSSWPLLFLMERANIEFILWIFVAVGSWALYRERPILAGVLFGVAASLKLYPIVMLSVLFNRKHFKAFCAGVAAFAASLAASFWFVGPTFAEALRGTLHGITGFVGNYASSAHSEIETDHSLLAAVKMIAVNPPFRHTHFASWTPYYLVLAGAAVTAIYLLRVRRMPVVNRLLFASLCMVALPPVSYDYTLVHLYLPFALFVIAAVRAQQERDDVHLPGALTPGFKRALACFAILFTPQYFLVWANRGPLGYFDANGLLKALAALALMGFVAKHPLHIPAPFTSDHDAASAEPSLDELADDASMPALTA